MRTIHLLAVSVALGLGSMAFGQQPQAPRKPARVCAVCQSWEAKDRTLPYVLEMLDNAAAERADIVCLPEDCVPTEGGPDAQAALDAIAKAAAAHGMIVAANLKERQGDKLYSTSYLIGADGKLIGKYRKSHRLPDEAIALGDDLPVFDTPFGKVGLMIGTDNYWLEVPLVLALRGAELILWSHAPEPVPQGYPLDVLLRMRAYDNHVTLAMAQYAGKLPYLCSNWPQYAGQPLGRACVVDRSGTIVADTGLRPGVATKRIDLAQNGNAYQLVFKENRSLFHYLVDPDVKPLVYRGPTRKIRVTIAQVEGKHGPNPDPDSAFFKILNDAGRQDPDLILMTEFKFPTDTPEAATTFAQVADVARRYHCYIVIGGLREPAIPYKSGRRASWAFLWDRTGKVVGKYRISQYGASTKLPVFKTDFGVIGLILCGDIYSQEITRALALQGAEIVLCGSQSWGASGQYNQWMQQARAIDNRVYMAVAHYPTSEISERSYVIDPYGYPVAATPYWSDAVCSADVDLDAGQVWFARSDKPGKAGRPGYLSGYFSKTIPEKRADFRAVLFDGRRPELYRSIIEKTLAGRDFPAETWTKMGSH